MSIDNSELAMPVGVADAPSPAPSQVGTTRKKQAGPRPRAGGRYATQVLLTSLPLVAADIVAIVGSTLLVFAIANSGWLQRPISPAALLLFLCGTQSITFLLFRLYPGTGMNPIVEFRQTIMAITLLFAAFVVASLVHDGRPYLVARYPLLVAATCVLCLVTVPIARSVTRHVFSRRSWWGQPVLIFGANAAGVESYKYFASHSSLGLRAIGIVDELNPRWNGNRPPQYLGSLESAPAIAERHGVYWAIVAMSSTGTQRDQSSQRQLDQVRQFIDSHTADFPHVIVVPDLAGFPSLWNRACECGGSLGIQMETSLMLPLPRITKRALDLTLVIVFGLLALPWIVFITLLVAISSRGNPFYGHERIGRGDRRFKAWKFRTMVPDADKVLESYLASDPKLREEWEKDQKLKNDPRVTKIGNLLRKTSLDEVPQIWNVLMGEMSLVGPRPIVTDEISKYDRRYDLYLKVLPGITGLWQVSGRNNTTYEERVAFDTYYVRNWSPWLDIYLLARTVKVVICREGAY